MTLHWRFPRNNAYYLGHVAVAYLGFGKGGTVSAKREPIIRVWGRGPQRDPEAESLVWGSESQKTHEIETFLAVGRPMEADNLTLF